MRQCAVRSGATRSRTDALTVTFTIKRIYEPASPEDGYRVLIDRLWPRGVSKERAQLDEWAKDIAPTAALRTWFAHEPSRFEEFSRRYRSELKVNPDVAHFLTLGAAHDRVTLLYGAHDPLVNQAVVLRDFLASS
jgi:uncharacterized protein YeaO (DUF488 family)